jgi:hypothetical protein
LIFCRVSERFVTREFKKTKRILKVIHRRSSQKMLLFSPFRFFFFPPRLFCSVFSSLFWAFSNKGSAKTRTKKRRNVSAAAKKSSYLQGAAQKQVGDPRGGWVGQRPKK